MMEPMNGSTISASLQERARRLDWQRGWMLKIRAIESRVSVGTATVAMILNGLGESLRQLYLVPQYFAGHHGRALGFEQGSALKCESVDCLGTYIGLVVCA